MILTKKSNRGRGKRSGGGGGGDTGAATSTVSTRATRSRAAAQANSNGNNNNNGKDAKSNNDAANGNNRRFNSDCGDDSNEAGSDNKNNNNDENDEPTIGHVKRDEDDHHAVTVIASLSDAYTLKQDMCLSCGSFGKNDEAALIACSQCGQSFHPYCAGITNVRGYYLILTIKSFFEGV